MLKRIIVDKITFYNMNKILLKNAQGVAFIVHEAFLIMNFLRTKPQVEIININYYDVY